MMAMPTPTPATLPVMMMPVPVLLGATSLLLVVGAMLPPTPTMHPLLRQLRAETPARLLRGRYVRRDVVVYFLVVIIEVEAELRAKQLLHGSHGRRRWRLLVVIERRCRVETIRVRHARAARPHLAAGRLLRQQRRQRIVPAATIQQRHALEIELLNGRAVRRYEVRQLRGRHGCVTHLHVAQLGEVDGLPRGRRGQGRHGRCHLMEQLLTVARRPEERVLRQGEWAGPLEGAGPGEGELL